jgi:hypothetical protein
MLESLALMNSRFAMARLGFLDQNNGGVGLLGFAGMFEGDLTALDWQDQSVNTLMK